MQSPVKRMSGEKEGKIMVCHSCHGQHWVLRSGQMMPCPECGGLGEIHCCEGLVAQQESSDFDYPVTSFSAEETLCLLPSALR